MPSEAGRRVPSFAGLSHRGVRASRGGGQGAVCELRMGRGAMRPLAPAGAGRAGAAARGRDRGRLAACNASPAEQWPSERVGCASVQSGVRDGAATVVAPAAPSVMHEQSRGGECRAWACGRGARRRWSRRAWRHQRRSRPLTGLVSRGWGEPPEGTDCDGERVGTRNKAQGGRFAADVCAVAASLAGTAAPRRTRLRLANSTDGGTGEIVRDSRGLSD